MKYQPNIKDVRSLGQRPTSTMMKKLLSASVDKREPDEEIHIHHYADRTDGLLLVIERRSQILGLKFENKVVRA